VAESVIIDDKNRLHLALADLIVESIRSVLEINDQDLVSIVYESMDTKYMPFICHSYALIISIKQITRDFMLREKSFLEWMRCNSVPFHEWLEVIEKLEYDERLRHV
jgi:hypothetical protein